MCEARPSFAATVDAKKRELDALRVSIRPDALDGLDHGGGHAAFDGLLLRRLDQTLDMYIAAAREARGPSATIARETTGED